jgi:hypothetical protein
MRVIAAVALLSCGLSSTAADIQAGKAAAQAKCSECHAASDWEGEDAASLESLMRDIAASKVKHKGRIDLSPAEMSNIAAYWGAGGTGKKSSTRDTAAEAPTSKKR